MNMVIKKFGLMIGAAFALGILPIMLGTKPAAAANLVTNGSFESPDIPNPSFKIFPSIPGWTLLPGSQGIGIEVQDHIAGTPFDGDQFVELDSNGVTGIFQDLATVVGQKYKLEFAFSPRQGVPDNRLNVYWGGNLVTNLTASGVGVGGQKWTKFAYELVATNTTTRLRFDDLDELSNSLGAYLDDVKVTSVPEPVTSVGLLVFGAVGATSLRKRKQKQDSAKA